MGRAKTLNDIGDLFNFVRKGTYFLPGFSKEAHMDGFATELGLLM